MKNLILIFFTTLSLYCSAQKITGFYSGTLFNDTTHMKQQYELALVDYRGKISGYSYVTFVRNDTFYYGIRKVKAAIVGDSLVVQDDKMIINNFPEPPAKHVGRIITIPLHGQDSIVSLNGRWRTNQTKEYHSIPGAIDLARSTDSAHSPLIAHLRDLGLIESDRYANVDRQTKQKDDQVKVKAENTMHLPAVVLSYDQRKNSVVQTLEVHADSLLLSFYDNGVVDGDTVSVYLDNQLVASHIRLTTKASKKMISVKEKSEYRILLVADNLGSIPPNTGLLMIRDGENDYQVNFSADMQTNAAIVIRRKK